MLPDPTTTVRAQGATRAERSSRLQRTARTVLALTFVALGLWVASGFLRALIWGVIIAIAVGPVYDRAETRWPRHRKALLPALFAAGIALIILVPLAVGVVQAAHEAHQLTEWLAAARHDGIAQPAWVDQLPAGRQAVSNWWQDALATPEAATASLDRVNAAVLAHSRPVGTSLLRRLTEFAFALLTLFFLLREQDSLTEQLHAAGQRLFGASGERVARQVLQSVRGTINGLVLVGIGEGVILAIAYFALGVPHPLLLGALTAVAAMIPLGAALMFGIAALLLLAQGALGAAIAILVIGTAVLFVADQLIRPALIGGSTELPFLWVLVGILGGVEILGVLGLFVGPAVMAVLIMLWREFIHGASAAAGETA